MASALDERVTECAFRKEERDALAASEPHKFRLPRGRR
jgi:hypothetical protein